MVNPIVNQSIDLRLKFEQPPRITASKELCVLCGMLCKIFDIPIPVVKSTGDLKNYVLSYFRPKDNKTEKLITLLSGCQKESEPMIDEWYEVMRYGYDQA